MSTITVIVLGILTWVLGAVLLAPVVARVNRLREQQVPAVEPAGSPERSEAAAAGSPVAVRSTEAIAGFPPQPSRFVGRAEVMAAADTALAPGSGHTAVVFHGMAGAGKSTCAVELTYRHHHDFVAVVYWSAPTDPDQCGDALDLLVAVLEAQLGASEVSMVGEIGSLERVWGFPPTLSARFADAGLLLVLDNLDTLVTADGQWHDLRWAPLIGALTGHQGPSRVVLTSRIVPVGLNPDTAVCNPVLPLSREESLSLVGQLPNLRVALRSVTLARSVLTVTQGHPQLLELADAAAADPTRLVYQLAEIEAALTGMALAAFLDQGHTRLDAAQLRQIVTAWTVTVATTAPTPARLLLQALCRAGEADRNTTVIGANWAALWRRWDQPGEPPPLCSAIDVVTSAGLITTESIDDPADPDKPVRFRIHPGLAETIQAATPEPVIVAIDTQLAAWWSAVFGGWGIEPQHAGQDTSHLTRQAGLAAARYLLRQHDWDAASCLLERTLIRDKHSPVTSRAVTPLLRRIAMATGAPKDLVVLGAALRKVDPDEAETLLRHAYDQSSKGGDHQVASTTAGELISLLRDQGRLPEAFTMAGQKIEHTRQAGFGRWTQLCDQGRRLQILNLLGHHEQVLMEVPALRAQMAELPDQCVRNERVNPWNAREGILDVGRLSAVALERWEDALELNNELERTQRRRGAGPQELARTRFNDYLPLRHLGRYTEADHLLRHCQQVFATAD